MKWMFVISLLGTYGVDGYSQVDHQPNFNPQIKSIHVGGYDIFDYYSDSCTQDHDYPVADSMIGSCKDQTLSYKQPRSTGVMGWNGYCGETAAANMLYNYCGMFSDPLLYIRPFMVDSTPGTPPSTFAYGLNEIFRDDGNDCPKGEWNINYFRSHQKFIQFMKDRIHLNGVTHRVNQKGEAIKTSPFALLTSTDTSLHWITVMDVYSDHGLCKAAVNQWGAQYSIPCVVLADMASNENVWSSVVGKFVTISFDRE